MINGRYSKGSISRNYGDSDRLGVQSRPSKAATEFTQIEHCRIKLTHSRGAVRRCDRNRGSVLKPLSVRSGLLLLSAAILVLALYNGVTRADLFRTHISGIPQARGFALAADFPNTPAFADSSGLYADLGYRFDLWSGGEWVALLGDGVTPFRAKKHVNKYHTLTQKQLSGMLRLGGLDAGPPVPGRGGATLFVDAVALWLLLAMIAIAIREALARIVPVKEKSRQNSAAGRTHPRPANSGQWRSRRG
jgi:hypothetical protein